MIGNSNGEHNFPHKLLLTNTQVSRLRKPSSNNSQTNIKLSKSHLYKIGQWTGFLVRLLGPFLKTDLPLIKNILKPLAKSILIPLGWTAAATATDAAFQKNFCIRHN